MCFSHRGTPVFTPVFPSSLPAMSYFNPAPGSNPLTFPSYNQQNVPQRGLSGLVPNQLQQYQRQRLPPHLQNTNPGSNNSGVNTNNPANNNNNNNSSNNNNNINSGNNVNAGNSTTNNSAVNSNNGSNNNNNNANMMNNANNINNSAGNNNGGNNNGSNAGNGPGNNPGNNTSGSSVQAGQALQSTQDDKGDNTHKRERKNRPGQKFGAKKKLWVWTWFVQDLRDPNVAVCDYCGKIITRMPSDKGSPKKLSEHLKTHKLTKELLNTARALPMDNTMAYGGGLQMPYSGYPAPMGMEESDDEPKKKYRRLAGNMNNMANLGAGHANANGANGAGMGGSNAGLAAGNGNLGGGGGNIGAGGASGPGLGPNIVNLGAGGAPNIAQNADYGRRFILPHFDNAPYLASKFHRHLLKFLADNKLSIRLLKLHSFQQLIYDLRPDSITDLLELTGLYLSFVEVSRADNSHEADASLAEASVVSTLAQELIKK